MEEPKVKGNTLPLAARFVLEDADLSPRLSSAQQRELQDFADSKPDVWVPRADLIRVWSIVDEISPDEKSAYANLVRGGGVVASVALSTFLKLLLRMLTPRQFSRKFPNIWSHEHSAGYVEAILGDNNTMVINVKDVAGFTHVGPVAVGFIGVVLKATGLKDLHLEDKSWTRQNPAPENVRIEVSWK